MHILYLMLLVGDHLNFQETILAKLYNDFQKPATIGKRTHSYLLLLSFVTIFIEFFQIMYKTIRDDKLFYHPKCRMLWD